MSNGQLPDSALSSVPGGRLRRDAALAWLALDAESVRRGWGRLQVSDSYRPLGRPGDLRAGRWSQWAAWERYRRGGNLAARPGTSNHGLGLAVDVPHRTRWIIDQIGARFGYAKRCSDAANEAWHVKYNPACTGATFRPRTVFVSLRYRSRGPRVRWAQRRLRAHGFVSVRATGFYGDATASAVRRFQHARGLRADGVIGKSTWAKLAR